MTELLNVRGVEDALLLLGRLTEFDRSWILERLPPAVKARLAQGAGKDDPETRLIGADVTTLVALLRGEPAWLVHAVLSAKDWPWKLDVVDGLPAALRNEVAGLSRRGLKAAKPAVEFLLATLSERLEEPRFAAARDWRFDSLVTGFTRGEQQ